MFESVIKFTNSMTDLVQTDEFWQSESFTNRLDSIVANIVKTTGLAPSKNRQPIREAVFQVLDTTSIDELKGLAQCLKEFYMIECFQISIERPSNTAHMLFDFNVRDTAKSVVLNRSQLITLSVMVIRYLHLPRPKDDSLWVGYYLRDRYNSNPKVFEALQEKLKHAKLGKESYALACDMVTYIEMMCKGQLK